MSNLRFRSVFKNQILYLEGISYFYLNNDDSFSPTHEKPLSLNEKKEILSIFRHYLDRDRQKAIDYVMHSKNYRDIIKLSCGREELLILFAAMLSRNHTEGLHHFFNVSLAKPTKYSELFGSEVLQDSTLSIPSVTTPFPSAQLMFNTKVIPTFRVYGSGSYGIIYSRDGTSNLYKFTTDTDSFISELMSTVMLMLNKNSELGYGTVNAPLSTVHLHEQKLKALYRCSDALILGRYGNVMNVLKSLIRDVQLFTEYSYMHLDITPNNVMWDEQEERLKIIDFSGTIGDDSFFDLGERHNKLCTRNSRPEEYTCKKTISMRNESSELFSLFYTVHELIDKKEDYSTLFPREKIDTVIKKFKEAGINELYMALGDLKMSDRPFLEPLIIEDESSLTPSNALLGVFEKIFITKIDPITVRRVLHYFKQWKPLFGRVEFPSESERRKFRDEILELWISNIPIYNLFRCIHLFDFVRGKLKHLPIRILARALLYICCSLSKLYVPQISHSENHPVYQVLREMVIVPETTGLLMTPLTAYLLLYIDNFYDSTEEKKRWFKCLYSRNELKRDFDEEKDIINFTNFYFLEVCREPLVEPTLLFEKYAGVKNKVYNCKSIEKQVKTWLCNN